MSDLLLRKFCSVLHKASFGERGPKPTASSARNLILLMSYPFVSPNLMEKWADFPFLLATHSWAAERRETSSFLYLMKGALTFIYSYPENLVCLQIAIGHDSSYFFFPFVTGNPEVLYLSLAEGWKINELFLPFATLLCNHCGGWGGSDHPMMSCESDSDQQANLFSSCLSCSMQSEHNPDQLRTGS